ncbi:MAG: hypothetical protein HYT50_00350 [Candidatus Wildermuthbacteria bacterium]|nr:hypothetical protein [Candidatus Wildermuthbacteria bacterium]
MRKLEVVVLFLLLALLFMGAEDTCSEDRNKVYLQNVETREEIFLQAQALYPIPVPSDFPLRKDLVEFTRRQARPGPWYVYIQTDSGSYSAYYVAKNKPQNACNFLSETKTIYGGVLRDAPSLDGVYYGGTGASGACDAWFWFDAATNALVETRFKTTVSDQPLNIDVPQIKIAPVEK